MKRRNFLKTAGAVTLGSFVANPLEMNLAKSKLVTKRIAMVGTGVRGVSMFGKDLLKEFGDVVELVGLCDINPGRVKYAKEYIGVNCPTFTNLEEMIKTTKPEWLIVTTIDGQHHEQIIKGMEMGCNIICEKPLTTEVEKANAILEAEKKYNKKLIVTFNYRYSPHRAKIKELLMKNVIGKITSVDFHWYLDTEHGPRYFRRWHGQRKNSGTLLLHKSTHHFDLVNWWLDSDPVEVFAYGALDFFGKNNSFRGKNCRECNYKDKCNFYWDITKDLHLMKLYVENEKYDGYIRDNCIFREEIDIYDKMSAQVKYENDVVLNYSLTTYSPYEGYRIAFNGTYGRLEAWIKERQTWPLENYDEIQLTLNFKEPEFFRIPNDEGGHGGGDSRMKYKIFKDPNAPDPLYQAAGTRDGIMSIMIGIAARESIEKGVPIKINSLVDFKTLYNKKN